MSKLLIVEDDTLVARTLRRRLERAGYEVVGCVPSGEEALEEAAYSRPDLVLMDMNLGGRMDGVQTAQQLRDRFNIPPVYLTANFDQDSLDRAKTTRPLGYILKPYQDHELKRTIDFALHNHQTEETLRKREFQYRYLSDATQVLISSLDPFVVLKRLAEFTVPTLGDFCIVDALVDADSLLRIAWAHAESEKKNLIEKMPVTIPRHLFKGHPAAEALSKGIPIMEPHITEDWLKRMSSFPVYEAAFRQLKCQSLLCLPLILKDKPLGALIFGYCESDRHHTQEELDLGKELAHRATIALEHIQLYQQSLNQIEELQRSEKMIEDLNRNLEKKVIERTMQLEEANTRINSSLKEKEVMLKEIHHRVKNNLQIISSLLRLQYSNSKDAKSGDLLKESQDRIQSMALVHELLYRSKDMSSIQFDAYMEKLIGSLFSSYARSSQDLRLVLNIPNVSIDLDTAIPLGLITTELVNNAFKYAFPNNRPGVLTISFKEEDNHMGTLTVQDNGVGFNPPTSWQSLPSVGFQIVAALCRQMDGKMDVFSNPGEGTRFLFTFTRKYSTTPAASAV